jgi:nucleoside 2-deoxyribosyltransferase
VIIKDVIDNIVRSQIVVADISPTNPNVYFEVGYALAFGKPIVLLAQRRDSPGLDPVNRTVDDEELTFNVRT